MEGLKPRPGPNRAPNDNAFIYFLLRITQIATKFTEDQFYFDKIHFNGTQAAIFRLKVSNFIFANKTTLVYVLYVKLNKRHALFLGIKSNRNAMYI